MMKRGDGRSFSHEKVTHHFVLLKDGGAIQVSANPKALQSRNRRSGRSLPGGCRAELSIRRQSRGF